MMSRIAFIFMLIVVQACAQNSSLGQLNPLAKFPSKIKEVSGMEISKDGKIWVIEDSGIFFGCDGAWI